jgi:hypothetical protein
MQWANRDLSLGPCGSLNRPIGYAIYSGKYSSDQILRQKPTPVSLCHPGVYNCPAIFNVGGYLFLPSSDVATVFSSAIDNQTSSAIFTDSMSGSGSFSGGWTMGSDVFGTGAQFSSFQPGVYTIVGGDEWGDIALLYFTVT